MSEKRSTMLFGGALFCAGLQAGPAAAQISDISFEFEGDPGLLQDSYDPTTGSYTFEDLSFSATGGLELLPFSQSADVYTLFAYSGSADVDVVGGVDSVTGNGSFDVALSTRFSGPADSDNNSSASALIRFTLDRPGTLSIEFNGFQDIGFGGVVLAASPLRPGSEITVFADSNVPPVSASVLLPAGTYELNARMVGTEQFGFGSTDFTVTIVPAPPVGGLFALGVALAVRRRR